MPGRKTGLRALALSALLASVTIPARGDLALATIVDAADAALASPNVHLMAHLPDPGTTGGRFAGNYFFMTSSGGSS